MKTRTKAKTISEVVLKTPRSVAVPEAEESKVSQIKAIESPGYSSACESSVMF